MRKWIPWAALGFVVTTAAVVGAQAAGEEKKYDTVDATVVSTNVEGMTITVKVGDNEQTEKVSALARTRLSGVKAGDRVCLTRKDTDGNREVVSIRPAKAAKK
jgi:hypothetical protein